MCLRTFALSPHSAGTFRQSPHTVVEDCAMFLFRVSTDDPFLLAYSAVLKISTALLSMSLCSG